jgi:hypothetical protein
LDKPGNLVKEAHAESQKQFQPSSEQEPPQQISNPQLITVCAYPEPLMNFLLHFMKIKESTY